MTQKDTILLQVYMYVQNGWPNNITSSELLPYFRRWQELNSQAGCVLLGSRLVMPLAARKYMLDILHASHPGITRMNALARSYLWWPGLDMEIENKAKHCDACQANQRNPAKAPLHPWVWPKRPWARLHIDFAGPFLNKMFLVTVDAMSKWLDVKPMNCATSASTIAHLTTLFSIHGLPEFKQFLAQNGIYHITSAPYHPSTNGLAERAVQTFKIAMKKSGSSNLEYNLSKFLFQYRITPHATTGETPSKLLMGRQLRSQLNLVHPYLQQHVEDA